MKTKKNRGKGAIGYVLGMEVVKVLAFFVAGICSFLEASSQTNKLPARITTVGGAVNNQYSVVYTTIYKDTDKPIITRAQLDLVGPNKNSSKLLDVKLELPMPPVTIETHGATKVLNKVGQFVGAVGGPKGAIIGTGISGVAVLADYAKLVAEEELNKLYENQQFRINLLEIIPSRYYSIDLQSGDITPTEAYAQEVPVYTAKLASYFDALKAYQDIQAIYAQWHARLSALDPSGRNVKNIAGVTQQWAQLTDYHAQTLVPAREKKNKEESDLSKLYSPYRIAIMASPSAPGNTCKQFGSGPWELYVIYYMGAMQTNQIGIKYCVPTPKSAQTFTIDLMQNAIQHTDPKNNQQHFMPGGIRITAAQNASFSRSTGLQTGDYGANKTEVLNWFTEMVVNPAGGTVASFMFPFEIHELRRQAAEKLKETKDAKMKDILDDLDKVIAQGEKAKGGWDAKQKELKETLAAERAQQERLDAENKANRPEKQPEKQSVPAVQPAVQGRDKSVATGNKKEPKQPKDAQQAPQQQQAQPDTTAKQDTTAKPDATGKPEPAKTSWSASVSQGLGNFAASAKEGLAKAGSYAQQAGAALLESGLAQGVTAIGIQAQIRELKKDYKEKKISKEKYLMQMDAYNLGLTKMGAEPVDPLSDLDTE